MEAALVTANIALVLVTLMLAIPNWRMSNEMRRTRLLSILPRLALDVKILGAGLGLITVRNVGEGPALDVQAKLTFEGHGDGREVAFHSVSEDQTHSFMPPRNAGNELMRMDELTAVSDRVTLRGKMHDALGNEHPINESIALAETWEITKLSHRRLDPDYEKETVDELKAIKEAMRNLHRIAERAFYSAWPPVFARETDERIVTEETELPKLN